MSVLRIARRKAPMMPKCILGWAAILIVLSLGACSPSLSPLYRDYQVPAGERAALEDRIAAALEDAGWDTVATDLPNTIATEERTLSNWGIYKVTAFMEVAPLGNEYVRVFIHPYRRYVFGGKGKIPFLTGRVRSKFMPELNKAFSAHGLHLAGTPFERDDTKMR